MMLEAKGILNHVENLSMEHHFREANVFTYHLGNEAISLAKLAILEVDFL